MTRVPARIDLFFFVYSDPGVNVTTEQRTVEHKTIDEDIVVQSLGRKPDQISISGMVTENEVDVIDDLTKRGVVNIRTERWIGDAIVKSTSTEFQRAKNKDGEWLYEATIECIEVDEGASLPADNRGSR